MPKLLNIHIGYPRTGTTSLQDALVNAQSALSQSGVYVPPAVGNRHRHLQVLGAQEVNQNIRRHLNIPQGETDVTGALDTWLTRLTEAASAYDVTVMSEETVALRSRDDLIQMQRALASYFERVVVFVCFRPHRSYVQSNYRQMIRATFRNTDVESYITQQNEQPFMNYQQKMHELIEVFGPDNVQAFEYASKGDVSSNTLILQAMGCKAVAQASVSNSTNQSREFDPAVLELKRVANPALKRGLTALGRSESNATLHGEIMTALERILNGARVTDPTHSNPHNDFPADVLEMWDTDWQALTSGTFASQFKA